MKEYRGCVTYLCTIEAENEEEARKKAIEEIEDLNIWEANDTEIEEV